MIEDAESSIVSSENKIVSRLAQLPVFSAFLLSGLPLGLYWLTKSYWNNFSYLNLLHWDVTKGAADLLVILVLISPFSLVVARRYKTLFYFFIAGVAWSLHCYFRGGIISTNPLSWLAGYSVPFLLVLTWFLTVKKNWPARTRILALVAGTLLLALLNGFASAFAHDSIYIRLFWGAHIEIFVVVAVVRFLVKKNSDQTDLDLILNPMNLISGVFWPLDVNAHRPAGDRVAENKVWWSGYYALITGCSLQILSMMMFADRNFLFSVSTFLGLLWITFCVFIGLTALARMTVGVARLYGADVPEATNFVLLSRSPVDSLRRGYVYAYDFNLRYICLPLFRRTRSIGFSVVCAFGFYVAIRFLFQPYLVPLAYNFLFPGFSLYVPHHEVFLDLIRSGLLLSAFLLEPLFNKIRMEMGIRYGTICCILLSYLTLSGMRQVEPFFTGLYRMIRDYIL